ncbi:HAMP domain-containing histidine kinase [Candidatus Obscuribacterales bacterium]|nr:HAMP domain-containing histidine kinase [Candidatus Obscuribacterales bacterium]MBX3149577.1 HAMP domain-containing histidine kinase [Candidatus Obscuribacterales bacterium]
MIKVKSKIAQKGLFLVIVPLVFEVIFMSVLVYLLVVAEGDIQRRIESKKIVAVATTIGTRVIDCQFLSMLYNAMKIPMLDVRFDEDAHFISNQLIELKRLCEKTEPRRSLSLEVESTVTTTMNRLRTIFTGEFEPDADLQKVAGTTKKSDRVYSRMTGSFKVIDKLLTMEQDTQTKVQAKEKLYREYIRQSIIYGVGAHVILTVVLAVIFAWTITKPIAILSENTRRLVKREPLAAPIRGDDELAHIDEVFHAAAQDLIRVDKQRKHLVSLVKDELSEPLRTVQYTLHNLSQGVLGDLSEKAENRILLAARDTDRVMRLIDDLLSIETMEGARFDLDLKETTSSEVVEAAIGSVKDMAERHGVKLEINDVGGRFIADKDRLVQVLINFLSNAIKFSPKEGLITVQVLKHDEDYEFRVTDRGRGVPQNKLEQIFEPFQQVESSDQTSKGGTGLGLPISKTIVEQHGGEIGVTSVLNEGSTFWFKIPRSH